MRVFSILGFCLLSSLSYAQQKPFGDAVAECAAKYQLPVNSPELQEVFTACEKEVERSRKPVNPDTLSLVETFEKCLAENAARFDDRISPASEIAQAAAAECQFKWFSVLKSSSTPPTEWSARMDEYPSKAVRDAALRAVLLNRRAAAPESRPKGAGK